MEGDAKKLFKKKIVSIKTWVLKKNEKKSENFEPTNVFQKSEKISHKFFGAVDWTDFLKIFIRIN